ncbi:MAG: nucleotidyltransferase [Bacilli bacterium]|nr:nucleotidyltransferase [Bacilli bacterium]
MKSVGIICEYNPFHNGHVYHIKKVKEMFPNYIIVLIMSGNFTQRGEVSLIDKWKKTDIALNYVDLVVELPFVFASQSADIFARGACDILKLLNAEALVFGSESDDVASLERFVKIQDSSEYNNLVKDYLGEGYNYPTCLSKALYDICGDTVKSSNDLLGLSYVKELIGSSVKYYSIKRTNDYLSKELGESISSGTSIRNALKNGKDVKKYVPKCSYEYLNNVHFTSDYFTLLKYKIISDDISKYQTVDEGIENRLKKVINDVNSLEDLIEKVKTKRYTYNKICRMLIHILTGFTKEEASKLETSYIRILGFNKKGKAYLKSIKDKCPVPIIVNYEKDNKYLNIESRVSNIYNLIKKDDILSEHQHKPIIH